MEAIMKFSTSKEHRSNSCLDRLKIEKINENRTLSLTGQSQSNSNINRTSTPLDSSTESIQRNSTPKYELYKIQRRTYQNVKKRFTNEVDQLLKDSTIIIVSDWLKVRGTFRDWTKLWAILKPGLLILYRNSTENGLWVGTVVLSSCQVIQRPTKKNGFCFKIWHPLEKSIWSQRGPNNEQFGALTFPLPVSYLICRASDETAGRCWIDALELTMKSMKFLQKPYSTQTSNDEKTVSNTSLEEQEFEFPQHFNQENDLISDISKASRSETTRSDSSQEITINETNYVLASVEEMGELGNASQTEEVAEENKSLILHLLKQIRPGMDLSKVILPSFILEPRSFLEKLSDYYYHCDILEEAVNSADPLERMKTIVKFYLSGFYKKPKGLKKPYNPVLGEVYRCYFHHPRNNSKTFYIAEQASHHPPITNFYASNRQEGFCVQGNILARSKFYGNSLSAFLDGNARITLLNKGEDYVITMPYVNCKGILIGRLTMELGGKVSIICKKTGYSAEIEFKLKPFIGGHDLTNLIEGKICLEKDVMYTFSGHWDDEIIMTDQSTNMKSSFWKVTQSVIDSRLKRYIVPIEQQQENESEKLWQYVTSAIRQNDQVSATEEKTLIENEQRKRRINGNAWRPKLFRFDPMTNEWTYIHIETRPWDSHNDISTYEGDFLVSTRTSHHSQLPKIPEVSCDQETLLTLQRIEQKLIHTIDRIECQQKGLNYLQNHLTKNSRMEFFFSYSQVILIIFVAFVLRFIFR